MEKAYQDGIVVQLKPGAVPQYKKYLDESRGRTITNDWWDVDQASGKESIGYPTQKPLALLDRIIRVSSNEDDMVLDPFCGCATALVAADRLDRQWVGIDLSSVAARLVLKRLRDDRGPLFDDVIHREDVPRRTDLGELPNYRTHKHTLYGRQEGCATVAACCFRSATTPSTTSSRKLRAGATISTTSNYSVVPATARRVPIPRATHRPARRTRNTPMTKHADTPRD